MSKADPVRHQPLYSCYCCRCGKYHIDANKSVQAVCYLPCDYEVYQYLTTSSAQKNETKAIPCPYKVSCNCGGLNQQSRKTADKACGCSSLNPGNTTETRCTITKCPQFVDELSVSSLEGLSSPQSVQSEQENTTNNPVLKSSCPTIKESSRSTSVCTCPSRKSESECICFQEQTMVDEGIMVAPLMDTKEVMVVDSATRLKRMPHQNKCHPNCKSFTAQTVNNKCCKCNKPIRKKRS